MGAWAVAAGSVAGLALSATGGATRAAGVWPGPPTEIAPVISLPERTLAEVGKTRVIAFRAEGAVAGNATPVMSVDPAGVLEVVSPASILDGESIGYVRVRGVAVGEATLSVGSAVIRVSVVGPRVVDGDGADRPRVVGPVAGACVWGVFSVGVERRVEPGDDEGRLVLRLGDGREIEATRVSDASMGPDRRAVFEVDAGSLDDGMCELTPVVVLADGREGVGKAVGVFVVRPEGAELTAGEAEARYEVERPRRFAEGRQNVGRSQEASGGAYFNNFGSYPAVCFPVTVERAGWHQVFVRAMGTLAGGELPWIDVVVDGAQTPVTGSGLVSMRWHRLAVGGPVWLEAGTRVVTPYFANDFYVEGAADRNLLIDTIEVARIGPVEVRAGEGGRLQGSGGLVIPSLDGAFEEPGGAMGGGSGGAMAGGMAGSSSTGGMMGSMSAMGSMGGLGVMSGGGVMDSTGMMSARDPMGLGVVPVRIALDQVLEGRSVTGDLLVEGQAWTPGVEGGALAAPRVALLVNGREMGRQRTFAPRFLVDADEFGDGANTIEMVAWVGEGEIGVSGTDSGGAGGAGRAGGAHGASGTSDTGGSEAAPSTGGVVARTPVQTVLFERDASWYRGTPLRTLRFGIHEPAWDDKTRELFKTDHYPRERRAVGMYSRETIRLELADDLSGRFRVGVEALGTMLEGAPELTFTLESAREGPMELGVVQAATWWDTRFVEVCEVPAGPKTLVVTFTNDRYQPGVGDRNVWIQSVVMREERTPDGRADGAAVPAVSTARDAGGDGQAVNAAPLARLLYPREGDEFFMAGAVVAEASDDRGVERVELIIDGVETGVRRGVRMQGGPIVLPLLARGLEPGEHAISVRSFDQDGNVGEAGPVMVRVLAREPGGGTEYDRAVTMLDRFAFGPDDAELAAILSMGRSAWLADRLSRGLDEAGEMTAMGPGLIWFEDGRYDYGPPRRALEHLYYTPNPARARFVLWAQNHFSTWIRKAEGDRKWREHAEFARLGAAPFQDLLLASARSPAMLRYLDQDQSFAGRLNENYAREIMELHTLGVDGGYTQADVTNLAGVLTGWTASTLGEAVAGGGPRGFNFRFDPSVSGGEATRVVGVALPAAARSERYDRALFVIEALAAHPSTARYMATRLCESYVCVPAPEGLVDALAGEFEATGGDMAAMLLAMSEHPEFWAATRARRMTTPLDYCLRLSRGAAWHHPWRMSEYLQLAGFQIFDRSTPDGYPTEDSAYGDSNAMIQRWSLAQEASWALGNLAPDAWRWDGLRADRAWAQRVVDAIAIGLTGRVLGERSNQATVDLLMDSEGSVSERVRMIGAVVGQMPEGNLK